MTKIINIIGNGGAGKTSIALNLGIALSQQGKDVILFDGNIYSGDLVHYADVYPESYLNEYLDGAKKKIEDTITMHSSGMKVIASMMEDEHDIYKHEKINQALLELHGKSDIVIVDCFSHNPALFTLLDTADETIFVSADDFPSIMKSKEFIAKLADRGIHVAGVVLNKQIKKADKKHVEHVIGKPILAEISHDKRLIEAVNSRHPIILSHPESSISKSIKELADLIG